MSEQPKLSISFHRFSKRLCNDEHNFFFTYTDLVFYTMVTKMIGVGGERDNL